MLYERGLKKINYSQYFIALETFVPSIGKEIQIFSRQQKQFLLPKKKPNFTKWNDKT